MSAPLEKLRRLAGRDVKDHTAVFDLYVTVGRDIDYLSIKFGMDPEDVIYLLEGYGERIRYTGTADDAAGQADGTADDAAGKADGTGAGEQTGGAGFRAYDGDDPEVKRALEEFGLALDYSGKGRLKGLPRILVEEYVERFYPGIASEHPENDWISIENYLEQMHPGWQVTMEAARNKALEEDSKKKKSRNRFRLFG